MKKVKLNAIVEQTQNNYSAYIEEADVILAKLFVGPFKKGNDLTLVTRNAKHFSRIPDLRLEVWA